MIPENKACHHLRWIWRSMVINRHPSLWKLPKVTHLYRDIYLMISMESTTKKKPCCLQPTKNHVVLNNSWIGGAILNKATFPSQWWWNKTCLKWWGNLLECQKLFTSVLHHLHVIVATVATYVCYNPFMWSSTIMLSIQVLLISLALPLSYCLHTPQLW